MTHHHHYTLIPEDGEKTSTAWTAGESGEREIVEGALDYKGRQVVRSESGGWRSASFIIGVEIAERFAYYGISSNLITYLTGSLGESTAAAAENVNVWSGAASMLPLLGAFFADSYIGRYRMIVIASILYILGLGLLTLSAVHPALRPPSCTNNGTSTSCFSPTQFQVIFFFCSLYLVALAQGGHKPCVQAFGADQFDERHPEESKSKSSFFNWWYFGMCGGTIVSLAILNYIQDNLSWGLGFGLPCIAMVVALAIFTLGTPTYRYTNQEDKSPFFRIVQVFIAAARNWRRKTDDASTKEEIIETPHRRHTNQFKFLDKAIVVSGGPDPTHVEEAKGILRLVPIWTTCLIYAVVFSQSSTFFTKQGSTMDRKITDSGFEIPAATLQTFISIAIIFIIPIYDRILVPVARKYTGIPSGLTTLQRIGTGMFLSVISMVVAALVEMKRLKTARDFGLFDNPTATVPMLVWWLVPQYVLFGSADVFTMVGLQEFFYDQVPDGLRSIGLSFYLSIFGIGSFLSGSLISAIDNITGEGESWFSNNLNKAHLDYFYWLLAGLSLIELGIYLYFAKCYIYKSQNFR